MLMVSAAPGQDAAVERAVEAAASVGQPEQAVPLSRDELAARVSSPTFRHGVFFPDGATVHPGLLVRALGVDEERRNASETDPLMTVLGLPYPTIVGKVAGGEWASTVMDRIVAEGRYGVRLGQTWREAEVDLRRCVAEACAADPFLREHPATVEITGGRFSSARIASDHPLPVGLADAAEAALGRRPSMIGEPYGADMRLLVNEGGTPTVMFGPGDVRVAHSADEYVPLAEVVECARTLAAWLVRELGPAA